MMNFPHTHYDEVTDIETEYMLEYDIWWEDDERGSYPTFDLVRVLLLEGRNEKELVYDDESGKYIGLLSEPDYDELYEFCIMAPSANTGDHLLLASHADLSRAVSSPRVAAPVGRRVVLV